MQRINIPLFAVRHGKAAGLNSSIYNLVGGLSEIGIETNLPYSSLDRLSPDFLGWALKRDNIKFLKSVGVAGDSSTRFLEESWFALKQRSGYILYPNYFLPASPHSHIKTCCIIHDCQHRAFPEFFSPAKRAWLDFTFKRTLTQATHVFLISEFERSQIAKYYGEALANRCTVLYNAIDWERFTRELPTARAKLIAEHPFILSVCHQYPHKNTEQIIDAFCQVANSFPELRLVLVGSKGTPVLEKVSRISATNIRERVILTGFISDADLGELYSRCALFALASRYEGFGMPAVEAMGFGVPTVVSTSTALPEVTLGLASYVDETAPTIDWSSSFEEILVGPRNQCKLDKIAKQIRTRYSPVTVAQSLVNATIT